MKLFNKIAAASLVISILLCGMISCTPKEENAYKAHVITSFTSDDADLVGVIVQIEKSEVDLVVYGDNIMAKSATKFSDIQLDKTVTVYGDIVYNETTLVAEGKTVTEKQKASFKPEQRAELLGSIGAGASIDTDDFNNVKKSEDKKGISYTCSGINADAKASLMKIFGAKFGSIADSFDIVDSQYFVEMVDGKAMSYILNTSFAITMGGKTYNVNMVIECEYDYDSKEKVALPEGTSEYIVTTYDDVIR